MKILYKYSFTLLIVLLLASCTSAVRFGSKTDEWLVAKDKFEGIASYYGDDFQGKKTANGEIYDKNQLTAAHRTLPFNTRVRVINKKNGNTVVVRINDRGPFNNERIIDLSEKAAEMLDFIFDGTTEVECYILE